MARRTSSSLTNSTAARPFVDSLIGREDSGGFRSSPLPPRGSLDGPAYMLPASTSTDGLGSGDRLGTSGCLPARNLSTIAAISSRLIFPPATGCAAGLIGVDGIGVGALTG